MIPPVPGCLACAGVPELNRKAGRRLPDSTVEFGNTPEGNSRRPKAPSIPRSSGEEITTHPAPPCPALRLHHHVRSAAALIPDPSDPITLTTHRPGELVPTRRDSRSPHPDHHSVIRSTRGWAGAPDRRITSVNRRGWQDVVFRNLVLSGVLRLPGASAWVRPALPSPMQLEDPSPR